MQIDFPAFLGEKGVKLKGRRCKYTQNGLRDNKAKALNFLDGFQRQVLCIYPSIYYSTLENFHIYSV